jgi:hypothetical protein
MSTANDTGGITHLREIGIASSATYFGGEIVVTCQTCTTQREHPPFESHINLSRGELKSFTNLYCLKCEQTTRHWIGKKENPAWTRGKGRSE